MAFDETVLAGTTGFYIDVALRSRIDGRGLSNVDPADVVCSYVRDGSVPQEWEPPALGWENLGQSAPGLYRVRIPDAALAVTNPMPRAVTILIRPAAGTQTDFIWVYLRLGLLRADLRDPVRAGLSALPGANAGATGGLPTVDSANAVNIRASSISSIASAVWSATTRTLTAIADSAGVTTLLSRLTAARAGYLDKLNLGDDNIATASQVNSLSVDVGGVQTDTTAIRATVNSLATMTETAGNPPYLRYKASALEQAPSGGAGGGFTEQDRTTLGAVKAKTDLITAGGVIHTHGPVSPDGRVLVVAGDDYTGARALTWTIPGEDFTGRQLSLILYGGGSRREFPCSGGDGTITCSLTSSQTAAITPRMYDYAISYVYSGARVTVVDKQRGFEVRKSP